MIGVLFGEETAVVPIPRVLKPRSSRDLDGAPAWCEPLEARCHAAAVDVAAVDPTLSAWGLNVYQMTNASLKVPNSSLYAETASLNGTHSGGDSGFAYVWP